MSYTALYRKFRPTEFDDVKGQDHIVTTLKNQITSGRIGHAYLFCGTRGTGKTTIAKIFAKSVNCENSKDGSPCGECASCKAIAAGSSMNVIEIDAASNNGVDNIREIVEEVSYSPVDGKYKVYIIDEVHMLSIGAFNALLKTLEEPPAYVIFILATTEVHKIPITILSRCQRYDFKRISIDTIADRLKELLDIEGVEVEDRAIKYVAKTADGSMRDALSLLDQCIAFHYGKKLTYDMVLDVLGAVDTTVFSQLLRLILEDNVIGSVELLEQIVMQGRELTHFVTDFTWYLRNLMLLKAAGDEKGADALEMSTEHFERLKEEASMIEMDTVMRYITVFSDLAGRLKYASQKRILIEMTLIRLMRPQMDKDEAAILDRIRVLEKKIENGEFTVTSNPGTIASVNNANEVRKAAPVILESAIPEDVKRIVREWPVVVGKTEFFMKSILSKAKLSLGAQSQLLIVVQDKFQAESISTDDKKEEIDKILTEHVGKKVEFEIKAMDDSPGGNDSFANLQSILGMTIEME